MNFIFNELCFGNTFPDIYSAKSGMSNLLQVCKKGRVLGMLKLAIRPDFHQQFLTHDYSIMDWVNDPTVNKNYKDLLLDTLRQPYIENNDIRIEERFILSYAFLIDDKMSTVEGLAIAYLYQTIAISIYSSEKWNAHEICLKFSEIGYDDQLINVNHASNSDHLELHKDWIVSRIGIKLPVTSLQIGEKEINLRHDHGQNVLLSFSKKLVRSQYVIQVINSLPFNPQETNFIRGYYDNGKIEIVLTRSDEGFGLIIQSTGRNLPETKAIAEILNEEFHDVY